MNLDYRTMFNTVIGPVLNYFGFHMNNDGILQQIGGTQGITYNGKHFYVPSDGFDHFATKDSKLVTIFAPFKIREHTIILSQFLCRALSNKFRDEEDVIEYNSNGEMIDIVKLVKRNPKDSDKLPAMFHGVIYEIWCRDDTDVLGTGIDHDGNDIKAIVMAMIMVLSKYSHLVDKNPNYDKIFRYIEKVELNKEEEIELARNQFSSNNTNIDLGGEANDGFEIVEYEEVEEDLDTTMEIKSSPKSSFDDSSVYDEIEF